MNLLFDMNGEVELSTSLIREELPLEDALSLYQTTLIYYLETRAAARDSNRLRIKEGHIRSGLNTLLERLIADLGEERALLFAAKSDLEIKLNY